MPEYQPLILNNEPFYWADPNPENHDHAILLLHGLGGGIYELRPLGERLHALGFSVQGVNYPGHGEAVSRMPHSLWQDWYEHVEAAYQELARTHQRVSLIGFSTGCPLALKLAHQYPVDRLVLLSPFMEIKRPLSMFRLEPVVQRVCRWAEHVPRMSLPIKDAQLRKQAETLCFIESFNLRSVVSALELITEVKTIVQQIENPTLIIQSPHDRIVDPQGASYLMKHLNSPEKELHWLKHSNHVITLDVEREEVTTKVLNFLASTGNEQ